MRGLMTVEQAQARIIGRCRRLEAENVYVLDALGRVLHSDVCSDIDVAPFDNSAMDGYAVRSADVASATSSSPVTLDVIAHVPAGGHCARVVEAGQAVRIMTGAPIPQGADAVVMVERTDHERDDLTSREIVRVFLAARCGEHIRRRGEEVAAGDVVLAAGETVRPAGIGLLAATGHETVAVYRRPRVAVLSTGDELVEIGVKPGPGKIRNSNSYSIAAQVISAGGVPQRFPIVPDDRGLTREAFERAAAEADFIVTTGGVSVGDHDHVKAVLGEIGEIDFGAVAMRPGSPQTFGAVGGVPFFGLPGNPSSTYVGFEVFVRPALRFAQGWDVVDRPRHLALLAHDVAKKKDRRYYLRGRVVWRPDAGWEVALTGSQSSALLMAAHRGNCLVVLPEHDEVLQEGRAVEVVRLDMEEGAV